MIKFYCDACDKEVDNLNYFEHKIHIYDIIDGKIEYIDRDLNPVSGRTVSHSLCNKCYNEVLIESVKKLQEIKKINQT
jgi:hypothetical protein